MTTLGASFIVHPGAMRTRYGTVRSLGYPRGLHIGRVRLVPSREKFAIQRGYSKPMRMRSCCPGGVNDVVMDPGDVFDLEKASVSS